MGALDLQNSQLMKALSFPPWMDETFDLIYLYHETIQIHLIQICWLKGI